MRLLSIDADLKLGADPAGVQSFLDQQNVSEVILTVQLNRLKQWYRPGVLCIGDAAHAMSPAGGVGINLAIQDANRVSQGAMDSRDPGCGLNLPWNLERSFVIENSFESMMDTGLDRLCDPRRQFPPPLHGCEIPIGHPAGEERLSKKIGSGDSPLVSDPNA